MRGLGRDASPSADSQQQHLAQFCSEVFASLHRADQRRWAHVYVSGLLAGGGRQSIREAAGRERRTSVDQALQHFVNDSPWPCAQIRARMLDELTQRRPTQAWVVEDVAFPRYGRYAAGVERQYSPALGRVANCQAGIVVCSFDGLDAAPVTWRLVLPDTWKDPVLRRRARIPSNERPRPRSSYVLEALDEVLVHWGGALLPVVAAAEAAPDVEDLLDGLRRRGVEFVLRVPGGTLVRRTAQWARVAGSGELPLSAAVTETLRPVPEYVTWDGLDGRHPRRSQFLMVPVASSAEGERSSRLTRDAMAALVEWPVGKTPQDYWLTNVTDRPVGELVKLVKRRLAANQSLVRLEGQYALHDFEGRSLRGWHHHVTLCSVAYSFSLLWKRAWSVAQDEHITTPA